MALHSKNIAISAGAPTHLVEEIAKFMTAVGKINQDSAKSYMKAHDIFGIIRQQERNIEVPLSTFLVSFQPKSSKESIVLHVLFDCYSADSIHVSIEKSKPQQRKQFDQINNKLFGDKGYEWL